MSVMTVTKDVALWTLQSHCYGKPS